MITMMTWALMKAKGEGYSWLLYLDCDEYLVLPHHTNIHSFLQEYQAFTAIGLNWILFGTNYHDVLPSPFFIKELTRCQKSGNPHVKTLVQVKAIDEKTPIANPHYWNLRPGHLMFTTEKLPMSLGPFNYTTKGTRDRAYIHHYCHQSYQNYYRRKINRVQDDKRTTPFPSYSRETLHTLYNDDPDTSLSDTYSKQIELYLLTHTKQ